MTSKSIAVPSRRKTGSKPRQVVAEPITTPVMPSRRLVPAPQSRGAPVHRFATGQLVSLTQPSRLSVPQAGLYRIVRPMPYEGGQLQYRVRGETDASERIVFEADISVAEAQVQDELP